MKKRKPAAAERKLQKDQPVSEATQPYDLVPNAEGVFDVPRYAASASPLQVFNPSNVFDSQGAKQYIQEPSQEKYVTSLQEEKSVPPSQSSSFSLAFYPSNHSQRAFSQTPSQVPSSNNHSHSQNVFSQHPSPEVPITQIPPEVIIISSDDECSSTDVDGDTDTEEFGEGMEMAQRQDIPETKQQRIARSKDHHSRRPESQTPRPEPQSLSPARKQVFIVSSSDDDEPETQSPPPRSRLRSSPPRSRLRTTLAETYPNVAHLFFGSYRDGMNQSQSPPQMAQSRSQHGTGTKGHRFQPRWP